MGGCGHAQLRGVCFGGVVASFRAAQPSGQLACWPRGFLLLDADQVGCPVTD
jgi:hypothetical protein